MIELARNKISLLRTDRHTREVARGAALAFVFKVAGSGLAFALNVAIARRLGAEGAGLYFLALSVTSVGLVIGSVGLRNALLRLVLADAAHQEWDLFLGGACPGYAAGGGRGGRTFTAGVHFGAMDGWSVFPQGNAGRALALDVPFHTPVYAAQFTGAKLNGPETHR